MTALQILDLVAFYIGYTVIGAMGLALAIGIAAVIAIGLRRDDEKRRDD